MNKKQQELKSQFEAMKTKLEAVTGLELGISGAYIDDKYTNYPVASFYPNDDTWRLNTDGAIFNFYNIDNNKVFINTITAYKRMTFVEAMANIKEPFAWTLEWAKQDLIDSFDWLERTHRGELVLANSDSIVVYCDGDVNYRQWCGSIYSGHPTFRFDSESDIILTEENYSEFKAVLQWYEDNVMSIKKPWEDK